jgi:hypothetical protein
VEEVTLEVSGSAVFHLVFVAYRVYIMYRPLSPVDSSFRALTGRLKSTVRRHKFNKDSPSL